MMNNYEALNPEQLKAVMHDKGPLLILAGAGSGKTRVITYRIAYLIEHRNVNPWNIIAITFTNKAANEMKERVERIVGSGSENIWVSTFHSACVRILRRFIDTIGYSRSFTIYDTDDQRALMKDVLKYLEIDDKRINERAVLSAISRAKDELISPEEFEKSTHNDYLQNKIAQAYYEYQKRLKKNNALDFDDLIYKTIELFRQNNEALRYYQNRFRYIMVDEYQDTNTAQFELIRMLASGYNELGDREYNLCVVGDDDQSIYKFRGANIRNILNFEHAFPNTKVIKLEQNYRSTKNILDTANEVIRNNSERKSKTLWTANEQGEPVCYTLYETDLDEADGIIAEIKEMVDDGKAGYNDFAVLYRMNAQSRVFEEKLVLKNIPYKIIGGTNFYARKEIKDLLAYLKTIDNGLDDLAVKRIINVPRRGIGLVSIDRIDRYALDNGLSFYEALVRSEGIPGLERISSKIIPFISLIEGLRRKLEEKDYTLKDLIDDILSLTGYLKELEEEDSDESRDRIANIDEFINKVVSYEENAAEEPSLSSFLEEVALVSDIDSLNENSDRVVLMTLHSAKGLEFPYVYICGMEEGIFPGFMSIYAQNPQEEIEEERRLCYVGFTRAKRRLSLSAARRRMLRGEAQFNRPSRFIQEIPPHLLTAGSNMGSGLTGTAGNGLSGAAGYGMSGSAGYSKSGSAGYGKSGSAGYGISGAGKGISASGSGMKGAADSDDRSISGGRRTSAADAGMSSYLSYMMSEAKDISGSNMGTLDYGIGDTVKHVKFGLGVVTNITKGGKDYEVTVDFPKFGTKKLLSSFAKLIRVD